MRSQPKSICPKTILLAALAGPLGAACGTDPATELSAGPETLSFDGTEALEVDLEANGSWVAHASDPWVSVEPESGAGSETLTVSVDRAGLDIDTYSSSISIAGDEQTSVGVPIHMRFPAVSGSVADPGEHLTPESASSRELRPGEDYVPGEVVLRLDRPMVALDAHGTDDASVSAAELQRAAASLADAVGARDSELVSSSAGVAVLEVESDNVERAIAALERDGRARYAEPNFIMRPTSANDPAYPAQWHYQNIHLEEAWESTTGYEQVDVAVIDVDFYPDHPDLADNFRSGWNFWTGDDAVEIANPNCGAHGTHVAGTIAAMTDNESGVAGVAPEVRVRPLNVGPPPEEDEEGNCAFTSLEVGKAVYYAAGAEDDDAGQLDEPVDVINMSLGGGRSEFTADALTFARDEGVVNIAAAGNTSGGEVSAPGSLSTTLAVSATDQFYELADYSAVGQEVWIAAPGGDVTQELEGHEEDEFTAAGVLSTAWIYENMAEFPGENAVYGPFPEEPGYGYVAIQGTSMASPHVAGVAALMRSANPRLEPRDVAEILAQTAIRRGEDGRTAEYGHGHLDADAAVAAARDDLVVPREDVVVRLLDGNTVVAEAQPDTGGAFELGEVEAGQYTLTAGDSRDGERGAPGTVYGEVDVDIAYDGDLDVDVTLTPR